MMSYNLINGYRLHFRQHCSSSLLILTRHFDEIICYLESWNGYLALPIKQKICGSQIQSKESSLSGHIFVQKNTWLAYSLHDPSSSSPALCRHSPQVTQAGCSHTIQRQVEFSCMMLWSNPNQQPGPKRLLVHSPISGIREKIKRVKAREPVG